MGGEGRGGRRGDKGMEGDRNWEEKRRRNYNQNILCEENNLFSMGGESHCRGKTINKDDKNTAVDTQGTS